MFIRVIEIMFHPNTCTIGILWRIQSVMERYYRKTIKIIIWIRIKHNKIGNKIEIAKYMGVDSTFVIGKTFECVWFETIFQSYQRRYVILN